LKVRQLGSLTSWQFLTDGLILDIWNPPPFDTIIESLIFAA